VRLPKKKWRRVRGMGVNYKYKTLRPAGVGAGPRRAL